VRLGFVVMLADRREAGPGSAPGYREVRRRALAAEEAGWDSIWLYDHLLYRTDGTTFGIWECWTMLSALAEATQEIRLGSLVVCTQFRNPALLAKMAATLDEVSAGRFTLGVGAGWNQPEFAAFGYEWERRGGRFEEALQIIAPLLREGMVDFEGSYYRARDCQIRPRGPSSAGPPLLVGTRGPRMLDITARWADMWNSGYLSGPSDLDEPRAALEQACTDIGREPGSIQVTAEVVVWYPDLKPGPPAVNAYVDASVTDPKEAMMGFEAAGVSEVMVQLNPYTDEAFERLTRSIL